MRRLLILGVALFGLAACTRTETETIYRDREVTVTVTVPVTVHFTPREQRVLESNNETLGGMDDSVFAEVFIDIGEYGGNVQQWQQCYGDTSLEVTLSDLSEMHVGIWPGSWKC